MLMELIEVLYFSTLSICLLNTLGGFATLHNNFHKQESPPVTGRLSCFKTFINYINFINFSTLQTEQLNN